MMSRILLAAVGVALIVPAAAAEAQRVPRGHMPPPGECRVWYPGVPPGQQPPPTRCRLAERQADRFGGQVIYGGRENGMNERRFLRWALRNFDYNRNGRLSQREYRDALVAWQRR